MSIMKNETPLIADRAQKQLTALGYKQVYRFVNKAAEIHGTNKYAKDFQPIKDQVIALITSLILDHNVTKEQLSKLQKATKIVDNKLQIPFINL